MHSVLLVGLQPKMKQLESRICFPLTEQYLMVGKLLSSVRWFTRHWFVKTAYCICSKSKILLKFGFKTGHPASPPLASPQPLWPSRSWLPERPLHVLLHIPTPPPPLWPGLCEPEQLQVHLIRYGRSIGLLGLHTWSVLCRRTLCPPGPFLFSSPPSPTTWPG